MLEVEEDETELEEDPTEVVVVVLTEVVVVVVVVVEIDAAGALRRVFTVLNETARNCPSPYGSPQFARLYVS